MSLTRPIQDQCALSLSRMRLAAFRDRDSAKIKIAVDLVLERAIATRVPNSSADSFEHDWHQLRSSVQSRPGSDMAY